MAELSNGNVIQSFTYRAPKGTYLGYISLTFLVAGGLVLAAFDTREILYIISSGAAILAFLYFLWLYFSLTYWGPGKIVLKNKMLSAPHWPALKLKDISYDEIEKVSQESEDAIRILLSNKKELLIRSNWFESKEDYLEFLELIPFELKMGMKKDYSQRAVF